MKLLSIDAAAQILGISRASVGRIIAAGSLPAITIRAGKRKKIQRIREDALRKFLNIGKAEPLEPALILSTKNKKRRVETAGDHETEESETLRTVKVVSIAANGGTNVD